jgi:hypothetical protein
MASTPFTTINLAFRAFATPFKLPFTLLNSFSQMMQLQLQLAMQKEEVRDRCYKLSLTYNFNYNLN